MLTRLEVRHPLSGDETNTYEFSLLFNLPEIPGQLASMVKAPSQSSLRVFPSQDAVGKLNFLGDRLEGIIEAFMVDRVETIALLEAGGYTFENGSSTAVFFLRVDRALLPKRQVLQEIAHDTQARNLSPAKGSEAMKVKPLRSRETKQVLSIMDHAAAYVWPRDKEGIPLASHSPVGHMTGSACMQSDNMIKPTWVDHHLVSIIKSIAAQSSLHITPDLLRQKSVRLVSTWRRQMLAKEANHAHANLLRFELWKSSPYGKKWMSGDFLPPQRPLMPCPGSAISMGSIDLTNDG